MNYEVNSLLKTIRQIDPRQKKQIHRTAEDIDNAYQRIDEKNKLFCLHEIKIREKNYAGQRLGFSESRDKHHIGYWEGGAQTNMGLRRY